MAQSSTNCSTRSPGLSANVIDAWRGTGLPAHQRLRRGRPLHPNAGSRISGQESPTAATMWYDNVVKISRLHPHSSKTRSGSAAATSRSSWRLYHESAAALARHSSATAVAFKEDGQFVVRIDVLHEKCPNARHRSDIILDPTQIALASARIPCRHRRTPALPATARTSVASPDVTPCRCGPKNSPHKPAARSRGRSRWRRAGKRINRRRCS